MPDWNKLYDEFESFPEGTWITGNDGRKYIKPAQSQDYHLEGMVICLTTGKIKHFSTIMEGGKDE